jgi:hypothetical protein
MTYIYYNAIHEAGHVIAALCFRLSVCEVVIKSSNKYAARCEFNPTRTPPIAVYGMKIAGSLAVDIQNDRERRNDDNGFGDGTDLESDAATVERLARYWKGLGMSDVEIGEFDTQIRSSVSKGLLDRWGTLEAIAKEIAQLKTRSRSVVSASQIAEIVCATDPDFYEQVKTQLVTH